MTESFSITQVREEELIVPSICLPIGRIQNKGTAILSAGRGKKGQRNILHVQEAVLIENVGIDHTFWRTHFYSIALISFLSVVRSDLFCVPSLVFMLFIGVATKTRRFVTNDVCNQSTSTSRGIDYLTK